MQPVYRLVIKAGPNVGKQFPLEKVELFIGRDLSNEVVVNDPEISRRHARLILQGSSFLLEDLGSTNGTFIRGQRLSGPYLLVPGDMITFGERINLLFEPITAANSAQTIQEPRRDFAPPPAAPPMAYPPASPGGYSATQIEPPASPRPAPPPMMPVQPPPQPVYQPAPPPPQPVYQPPAQPIYQPPPAFEPYQPQQPVQPPYAGQVPMPPPPPAKKAIPAWMWVVVAILLLIIVVLVIDDFRLWYVFGLK